MASEPARHGRGAFTLVELLVVIAIFVLLLAIAVPAFSSMMRSSEESLAENSLRIGLSIARDAAARNPAGRDTAAVFFYDPETKHTSMLACTSAGVLVDTTNVTPPPPLPPNTPITREVFVPVTGYEPVQLPRGWNVRGYAPPSTIDEDWYEDTYLAYGLENQGNWLFPETDFLDVGVGTDGRHRQTFMVRFEGGTGLVKMSDLSPVLVVSLLADSRFRTALPWSDFRGDLADDQQKFVKSVLGWPLPPAAPGGVSLSVAQRQQLLGDQASDTVLAKPVGQLAVYDEKRMLAALRVRPDPDTQTIYRDPEQMPTPGPAFVAGVSNPAQTINDLNAWIQGYDSAGQPVDTDCRIFGIQRYLGTLQELTGSRNGAGVQGGGA